MADRAEARLTEHGITLPPPSSPGGNYVPVKTVGHLVFLAGVISTSSNEVITGTVGANRSVAEGYMAARACALTQLAVLRKHLGSLDLIKSIISVNGYVNCVPDLPDSPKIINGASVFFLKFLVNAGKLFPAAM